MTLKLAAKIINVHSNFLLCWDLPFLMKWLTLVILVVELEKNTNPYFSDNVIVLRILHLH